MKNNIRLKNAIQQLIQVCLLKMILFLVFDYNYFYTMVVLIQWYLYNYIILLMHGLYRPPPSRTPFRVPPSTTSGAVRDYWGSRRKNKGVLVESWGL